jgi:hypothetical protein
LRGRRQSGQTFDGTLHHWEPLGVSERAGTIDDDPALRLDARLCSRT